MRTWILLLTALLLTGAVGISASTPQSSNYSMTTPGEVEIPARDLTVDGESHTIGAFGQVSPGETINLDVSAPQDAEYSVYLYDRNLRIEQTTAMSGAGRASFSTDSLSPGSYLAAVYDGGILEVCPVVVKGYDMTIDAPTSASGEVDVTVDVADGALTQTPSEIQVVFGDDERSIRVTATRVSDGEYQATLPTDGFESDTYALYGVVRGEEKTEGGDRVILAISERHEIQVETTSTPTVTPESGDGGSDSGGSGQAGSGAGGTVEIQTAELLNETVTTDESATVRVDLANPDPASGEIDLQLTANGTVTTAETVSVASSTERTVFVRAMFDSPGMYGLALNNQSLGTLTVSASSAETPTETAGPETPSQTATPTSTTEAVVTPRPTTADPAPTTTSGDGAGFGVAVAALAVALAALALGRRQR